MSRLRELQDHVHTLRQENELLRKRVTKLEDVLRVIAEGQIEEHRIQDAAREALEAVNESEKESEER